MQCNQWKQHFVPSKVYKWFRLSIKVHQLEGIPGEKNGQSTEFSETGSIFQGAMLFDFVTEKYYLSRRATGEESAATIVFEMM